MKTAIAIIAGLIIVGSICIAIGALFGITAPFLKPQLITTADSLNAYLTIAGVIIYSLGFTAAMLGIAAVGICGLVYPVKQATMAEERIDQPSLPAPADLPFLSGRARSTRPGISRPVKLRRQLLQRLMQLPGFRPDLARLGYLTSPSALAIMLACRQVSPLFSVCLMLCCAGTGYRQAIRSAACTSFCIPPTTHGHPQRRYSGPAARRYPRQARG